MGRIKGNLLFVLASSSVRMEDKHSLIPLAREHASLFGPGSLNSASADKGYWSAQNHAALTSLGVTENGLQRPANVKSGRSYETKELRDRLRDRRAGIEPLIGHAKQGGQLGRSRMKSDSATLAAGYGSVLGFNLRQVSRRQRSRKAEQKAAV